MKKIGWAGFMAMATVILSLTVVSTASAASRVATIVFGLCHTSDGTTIPSNASVLLGNSLDWVTKGSSPATTKVLILVDDMVWNSGYTGSCDPTYIRDVLTANGYTNITTRKEPIHGARKQSGYEAIIYVGESFELDDPLTANTLTLAHLEGVGIILTGDDASWMHSPSPPATRSSLPWQTLTRLNPVDNGVEMPTDTVSITDPLHPIMAGPHGNVGAITTESDCSGPTPCTANDIDNSLPFNAAQVLAQSSSGYPAVVAWGAE